MNFKEYKSSYIDTQPTLLKKFNKICNFLENEHSKVYRHQITVLYNAEEEDNGFIFEIYSNSNEPFTTEKFINLLEDDIMFNLIYVYFNGAEYFNVVGVVSKYDDDSTEIGLFGNSELQSSAFETNELKEINDKIMEM